MKHSYFVILTISLVLCFTLTLTCKKHEEDTILNDKTKLPEENADLTNVLVNGDTLRFVYKSGAAKPTFQSGDIVVGQTGEGYLKKVVSNTTSGDTLILFTEQAALTDAIQKCDIDTTLPLSSSQKKMGVIKVDTTFIGKDGKKYFMLIRTGELLVQPSPEGREFEVKFPNVRIEVRDVNRNLAVFLSCDTIILRKGMGMELGLKIKNSEVTEFKAIGHSSDGLDFKGVKLGLEKSFGIDTSYKLTTVHLGQAVVMAGPVPIVFIFEFGIYLGFGVDLSLNISSEISNYISLSSTNSIGARYENGSWQTVMEKTLTGSGDFSFNPVTISAELQGFLKGSLDTKIYGVAGPSLWGKLYEYNEVTYPPFDYELGIGIAAGLGFKVEILSWLLAEFDWTFADYRWPIVHSTTPPNNPPNTPSTPSGPSSGNVNTFYEFSSSATDPDDDNIAIRFDWGNGVISDWSSFVSSGQTATTSYSWSNSGNYYVKAQAKDEYGDLSGWSGSCQVSISDSAGPGGTLRWRYQLDPEGDYSSPVVNVSLGVLYIGTWYGELHAVDLGGHMKWKYSTSQVPITSAPALGPDGTIYFGCQDGAMYALNPTGTLKWRYVTGGPIVGSPAIGSDGSIFFGSYDSAMYALDAGGHFKWRFYTEGRIISSPGLAEDGTIYFGSEDGRVRALNPDGGLKWDYNTGSDWVQSSPAIGADGAIYFGLRDGGYYGYVYAFETDGTLRWRCKLSDYPGGTVSSSPAIGSNGTIYIGSSWGFYAVKPDGTQAWRYDFDSGFSSPLIGTDGVIYAGSTDNALYAVDYDGNFRWKFETGGWVESSPAIYANTIYISSRDGYLYAISCSGQIASTPWPKFRHDLKNTGRVGGGLK